MGTSDLFLSCDWGTSRFRLRLAELNSYQILAEVTSAEGVARLANESTPETRAGKYQQVLRQAIGQLQRKCDHDLSQLPIVLSGMASSSLGWKELPYAGLPFALSGESALWENLGSVSPELPLGIFLVSGVRSEEDVMRGEETEALGAWALASEQLAANSAIILLPGTHSKHVEIQQGQIVNFQTYMTGELFELLSLHSVLKHSVSDSNPDRPWVEAEAAFLTGVQLGVERPLPNALFLVRTGSLLAGKSQADGAALLSGILIGSELAALNTSHLREFPILLCATGQLSTRYQTALKALELSQPVHVLEETQVSKLAMRGQAVLLESIRAC